MVPMAAVITWGLGHATVPSGPGGALSQGLSPRGASASGGGAGQAELDAGPRQPLPGSSTCPRGRDSAWSTACSLP